MRARIKPDKSHSQFEVPPIPKVCAPRKTLMESMHKASRHRLVFVCAPSGFGKSISTQLWVKESGRSTVWIALDTSHNVAPKFYRTLCKGLLSLQPDNSMLWTTFNSSSFEISPFEHTLEMVSCLKYEQGEFAIVLDNLHLINDVRIKKSLLLIQEQLPYTFVMVLISQNETILEYLDLQDIQSYSYISTDDLVFSPEEIKCYFKDLGHSISVEESAAVHALTDGWAIGVNALRDANGLVYAETKESLLSQYIDAHLWDSLTVDQQDLLLKTSIFEEVSVSLVSYILNLPDAEKMFEELCDQIFFITRCGNGVYRYHALFQSVLNQKLVRYEPGQVVFLHKKAAQYYLMENDVFRARRHALDSNDTAIIQESSLIMRKSDSRRQNLSVDEFVSIYRSHFGEKLPEEACTVCPYLYSQYAGFYFLIGDATMMEHCLDELKKMLGHIALKNTRFLADALLIMALDHRISISSFARRIPKIPFLPDFSKSLRWSTITMQMPFAHRSARDYSELHDISSQQSIVDTLSPLLGKKNKMIIPLIQSGLSYEQGEFDESLRLMGDARALLDDSTSNELSFCYHAHAIVLALSMGDEDTYADEIKRFEDFIRTDRSLLPNYHALRERILLTDGDRAAATRWLKHYFVTSDSRFELYKSFQDLTTARAYMVLGEADKAKYYLDHLIQLGKEFHRPLDTAEASVLLAIVEWALGKKNESLAILKDVLSLLQEYNFVQVIANEGADILPALKKLYAMIKKEGYPCSIDLRYLNKVILAAHEQSMRKRGLAAHINPRNIRLSRQQKLVLKLLSKGYKPKEIAELTELSISTVKFHLNGIYNKLSVDNAMDAVLKSKDCGLL